ncbi:hypothetical protein AB0H00_13360 [Nocardia sp. NPDC023852]|uniref:hypothetical protein n=1 Tax=Nocardia sp. NPDC023852 TaxID=3154697 RepID=UPI0033F16E2A
MPLVPAIRFLDAALTTVTAAGVPVRPERDPRPTPIALLRTVVFGWRQGMFFTGMKTMRHLGCELCQ